MTQEEKQLLLQDLCARLFYSVVLRVNNRAIDRLVSINNHKNTSDWFVNGFNIDIIDIKPYLRPMSSMTAEEKEQLAIIRNEDFQLVRKWLKNESIKETGAPCPITCGEVDYCNKNHFDYRGLIPMGLAIEAPEGMYKTIL